MRDVVPDHRSVEIVGAGVEHQLRHAQRLHDPERLRVGDVVEHESRDRERAQVLQTGRPRKLLESTLVGKEGEWNDRLEVSGVEAALSRHRKALFGIRVHGPAQEHAVLVRPRGDVLMFRPVREGSILLLPQQVHVHDPLSSALHMAVEHGRVGVQSQLMGGSMDVEPLVAPDLPLPGGVVGAVVEDLRAAPRQRSESGLLEIAENRERAFVSVLAALGDSLEVHDLDRREGLEMDPRHGGSKLREHRGVVLERQPRVQPSDDVQFGGTGVRRGERRVSDFVDVHLVRPVLTSLPMEGAEGAAQGADVGVVDVPIDVVERRPAVHPPPDEIRQGADAVDVGSLVERQTVLEGQAIAPEHLLGDRDEFRRPNEVFRGEILSDILHGRHRRWFARPRWPDSVQFPDLPMQIIRTAPGRSSDQSAGPLQWPLR